MLLFSELNSPALLSEATGKGLTHLTHLEDAILDDGPPGATFALGILREFGRILNGGTVSRALDVHTKWDGAPSLIFGIDPADGQFFVSTKGALAKSPKLGKSHQDINTYWSSGPGPLLHIAFDLLAAACPSQGVFQGDAIFIKSVVTTETIDGVTYFVFRPNTITYAVDVNSDLGQRVFAADFGIVLHTMYTGTGTLANMTAKPITPSAFSSLRRVSGLLVIDNRFDDLSGTVTFTSGEYADFQLAFAAAAEQSKLGSKFYAVILSNPLHDYLQQFINAQVRQNQATPPGKTVHDLFIYFHDMMEKEVKTKKSAAGQQAVREKFEELIGDLRDVTKQLTQWFVLHQAIARTKNIVVQKLNQASKVGTFVSTPNGYKVTGPEGYVACGHDGRMIKLVDRMEFSRLNFTVPKAWK